jgi:hypothetical protein
MRTELWTRKRVFSHCCFAREGGPGCLGGGIRGQFLPHDSSVTDSMTRRVCSHQETDVRSHAACRYSYFATSTLIQSSSNMICTKLLGGQNTNRNVVHTWWHRAVRDVLRNTYHNRWMRRGGLTACPPSSPVLINLDFYRWGHLRIERARHHHIVNVRLSTTTPASMSGSGGPCQPCPGMLWISWWAFR